jgi:DNA-directed RNA polymerase specialized sigma24 family protein
MASPGTDLHALLTHAAWLRRLARRLADLGADADDLVQETWTAAWLRPPDAGRAPRPWLAEVLRNFRRMSSRASSRRRERELMVGDDLVASAPDPRERLARVELQRLLAELVRRSRLLMSCCRLACAGHLSLICPGCSPR